MKIIRYISSNHILDKIKYFQNLSENYFQKTSLLAVNLDVEIYNIMNKSLICWRWTDEKNNWRETKRSLKFLNQIELNKLYQNLNNIDINIYI